MDKKAFENIEITGVDSEKSYRPDERQPEYNIYFTLSTYPPYEWRRLFDEQRATDTSTPKRKAWVDGKHIVFRAPLEEIEKQHLDKLKKDVTATNTAYKKAMANPQKSSPIERKKTDQEIIEDFSKRLKF